MNKQQYLTIYSSVFSLVAIAYALEALWNLNTKHLGWHFRFLTVWGYHLAGACHLYLAYYRYRRFHIKGKNLISSVAVMNVMVLFLYWRLYFINPKLVNGDVVLPFIKEYYLHGVGPLALIWETLFHDHYFSSMWKGMAGTVAFCTAFVIWLETIIAPFSLLPYPFLRGMPFPERVWFYLQTIAMALLMHILLTSINRLYFYIKDRHGRQTNP